VTRKMGKPVPLEAYRRKRDFTVTPEPPGEAADGPTTATPAQPAEESHTGGLYVIQKHASSRLHWDFRIELGGTLLSWAVPKGPSFDTAEKRLAVHVEDHPVEYGEFEGTIPKGEYGGGTVMLWDRGTWEPFEPDPEKHLAEGHLKMVLHGERLRGRWVIVRTRGYGSGESWLLIKEHDGSERPHAEFDATAEWTASVSTGRTMDEIASGGGPAGPGSPTSTAEPSPAPAVAAVPGAARGPMPHEMSVELATLVDGVPEGDSWTHEVKWDGYRIVAFVTDESVRLVSRNGKDWTDRFPEIAEAIASLAIAPAVLDGEVVSLQPDGRSDFGSLQYIARGGDRASLHYQVFDVTYAVGFDLRGVTLEERRRVLASLVPPGGKGRVRNSVHLIGDGADFYASACEARLEGVLSKRLDSTYREGRHRDWVKAKCIARQEFAVVGWTDPAASRTGFGALVLGVPDASGLRMAGRVGTGFSEAAISDLRARLDALAADVPAVVDPPRGAGARGIHWVHPELVAEVAFAEWTGEGHLRHPSFVGLRDDKAIAEVRAETSGPAGRTSAPGPVVASVRLTNPDRLLWPEVPFTKLQLARYWEAVAPYALPHIVGRPLSLFRCPDGHTGECFFQKVIEHFPPGVGTVPIYVPSEDVVKPYGRIEDVGGLIGLAQMDVLEIHTWGSRADDPDKPDRLVLDIDPDTDLPFQQVAATALLLRSELASLGLRAWLKTTGGKGLHVVVPLTRRHSWSEVHDFSKAFVESVVALEPRVFAATMSKADRGGRIYLDYVRNNRGATAVAPYSTRARPFVPIEWEELEAAKEMPAFPAADVMARLAKPGFADPWADMGGARQSITAAMRHRLPT
jgi:bifunctional non-homologous end joining protein LigD